jgi:hypothetical protein
MVVVFIRTRAPFCRVRTMSGDFDVCGSASPSFKAFDRGYGMLSEPAVG